MNDILDKCLKAAGLVCLPKPLKEDSKRIWVKAIGKAKTACGVKYAILNNEGDKYKIKKTFGPPAAIICCDEIYPYEFLDKRFTPDFRSDAAIIEYLRRNDYEVSEIEALLNKDGKEREQIKTDRDYIKSIVTKVALKVAVTTLEDDEKLREKFYGKRTEE